MRRVNQVVLFVAIVLIAVTGALARSARSARSSSGFYTAHQDSGFAKLEDISSKQNQFVERHPRNGGYDSSVPQLEEQKIPVHVVYYYPEEVISHNIDQVVQNTTVASIPNSSWHDQSKEDAHSSTEQREVLNITGQENVTTHGISSFNSTQNINISAPENLTNFTNENINKEQSVQEHLQTSNRTTHSKSIKFGSDISSTRNTLQNVPLDSRSTGFITKPLESIGNMALPHQDQLNENGEISIVSNGEKSVATFNNDNLGYSSAITSFNDSKLNPTAAGNGKNEQNYLRSPQIQRQVIHQQTILGPASYRHQVYPPTNNNQYQGYYGQTPPILQQIQNQNFYQYKTTGMESRNPYNIGAYYFSGNDYGHQFTPKSSPEKSHEFVQAPLSQNIDEYSPLMNSVSSLSPTNPQAIRLPQKSSYVVPPMYYPNSQVPLSSHTTTHVFLSPTQNNPHVGSSTSYSDSLPSRAEAMDINTNSPYRFSSASMLSHGFVNPSFMGIPGNQQPSDQRDLMMSSRISWPFADYFPIVINDPLLAMFSAFTNMVEYGPAADVCRKLDSTTSRQSKHMREFDEVSQSDRRGRGGVITFEKSRPTWTFLGNARDNSGNVRTIPEIETELDRIKNLDMTSASSNKSALETEEEIEELRKNKDDETEIVMSSGNRKGAGPFITRLVVRRGGVSIAGPGGVATAGSGGTAIVGPGGVAYTSPNGLAVVGPGGKVVSLPSGLDVVFTQDNSTSNDFDGSQPRVAKIPPGGRLLATGPIVYYHQPE